MTSLACLIDVPDTNQVITCFGEVLEGREHLQRGGRSQGQPEARHAHARRQEHGQRAAARPVHDRVADRRQQLAPRPAHDPWHSSAACERHIPGQPAHTGSWDTWTRRGARLSVHVFA